MKSREMLQKMNDLSNRSFELFADGWTKSQLLGTLSRKGTRPDHNAMLAINTAWNHYQDIGKKYDAH